MTGTSNEYSDRVVAMFQELLRNIPVGAATVESRRTQNDDGTIVWLKPSNPKAAEFSAHIEDFHPGLIDVSFGYEAAQTSLELPWEAKLPNDASFDVVLGKVRDLALAVIVGECEQRFGFLGIKGKIRLGGDVYGCTHLFHPRLIPKTVHYSAYSVR